MFTVRQRAACFRCFFYPIIKGFSPPQFRGQNEHVLYRGIPESSFYGSSRSKRLVLKVRKKLHAVKETSNKLLISLARKKIKHIVIF